MTEPAWLARARTFIGFHETGDNRGIQWIIDGARTGGREGESWCADYVNYCFETTGYRGTRSAMARSFEHDANFIRLDTPQLGCVVTFWRGSPSSGSGHVGFYVGEPLEVLGGNQGSGEVSIEPQNPEHVTGYWWPAAQTTQPQSAAITSSNFDACLPLVLASEGGNDDDPRDPGGRTSRGILQREWDKWRASHPDLPADVWQAPDNEVRAIYRANYWNSLQCDQLPAGVDYAAFDFGVNSGISRSAKFLQAIIGTDQDGEVGPLTIAAARAADAATVVNQLCDKRLAFLQSLPTWPTFGRGWSGRISRVRADSLAIAVKGKPMTDTDAPTPLPAPAPLPLPQLDFATFLNVIKQDAPRAGDMIKSLVAVFNAINSHNPITLPGSPAAPAPTPAPIVLPAPAPAASTSKPSVWLSLAGFGISTALQLLGMVGAPLAIPGLIPTTAVTAAGTLSTLVPLISAAFGKAGGWGGIGKVLGAIGPVIGQVFANAQKK